MKPSDGIWRERTYNLRRMLPKYRKYNLLQRKEKFLFLEALVLHLWVGLLLKVIPFRWIPRIFSSPQSAVGTQQSGDLQLIKSALLRAGRVSPWMNRCLVSSLAARRMLNRRKISSRLSLGVAKSANGQTIAHAWLKVGDFEVVEKSGDYKELYLF